MTLEDYLQKHYSKSTLNSNLYNIKRLTDYYNTKSEQANYQDILDYLEHQRKNYNLHPKTLKHRLYAVKLYYHYLLAIGKRKDHPCSELQLKDRINKQIKVDTLYNTKTLENFLESYQIKKKKHLEQRNKVIISLLIYQGLTVQEITGLKTKDIDLEKGTLTITKVQTRTSKSPRSRTLPLQARQILLFYHYQTQDRENLLRYNKHTRENKENQGNPNNELFILNQYGKPLTPHSISKLINENKPKTEKLQPMKIRQSVIANLLKKEHDARVVQVFSGHQSVSTTIQYQQSELEELQVAIQRYHPIR